MFLASMMDFIIESTMLNFLSMLSTISIRSRFLLIQVWIIFKEIYMLFPSLILLKHYTKQLDTNRLKL